MPRREIVVGDQEKHRLVVEVFFETGDVGVSVDGKELPSEAISIQSENVPDLMLPNRSLLVGNRERHRVDIEFGKGIPAPFSVYVDGNLA